MTKLKAIVYTRPFPIGGGDYTFFERPVEFAKDREFVDAHIRNVLHEDDAGIIGSIVDRRWHVFRQGDFVVVGMATNEFERRDECKRPIRGYYGFAMLADDVALPSEALFMELDKICVEPSFKQAPVKTKDSEWLAGGIFDDPVQYTKVADSGKWQFNMNANRIRFHVYEDLRSLLLSSLAVASNNLIFEIVIGLNTVEHAKQIPVLNCVCHAVHMSREILIDANADMSFGKNTTAESFQTTSTRLGTRPSSPRIGIFAGERVTPSSSLKGDSNTNHVGLKSLERNVEARGDVGRPFSLGANTGTPVVSSKGIQEDDKFNSRHLHRSRIVVDLEGNGEMNCSWLREFLNLIQRMLELFGCRGHCRVESVSATEPVATETVKKDCRKNVRSIIEQGYGKKQ